MAKPHLRFAGLQGRTLEAYWQGTTAIFAISSQGKDQNSAGSPFGSPPRWISRHPLFQEGESLSAAGHLLSSIKRFIPEFKNHPAYCCTVPSQLAAAARTGEGHTNPSRFVGGLGRSVFVQWRAGISNHAFAGLPLFSPYQWDVASSMESPVDSARSTVSQRGALFSKTSQGNPQVLRVGDPIVVALLRAHRPVLPTQALMWPFKLRQYLEAVAPVRASLTLQLFSVWHSTKRGHIFLSHLW